MGVRAGRMGWIFFGKSAKKDEMVFRSGFKLGQKIEKRRREFCRIFGRIAFFGGNFAQKSMDIKRETRIL